MRLFQIKEDDLAALECVLPQFLEVSYPHLTPRLRVQWRRVQEIIRDVRWNYGPPGEVEVIPANGGGE